MGSTTTLFLAVFGLAGVFSRYFLNLIWARPTPMDFPVATFAINILGSFLIGVVYVLGTERNFIPANLRIPIMIGFLGGFTTFSAFTLETSKLIEESRYVYAFAHLILSPVLGVLSTFLGLYLARLIFRI